MNIISNNQELLFDVLDVVVVEQPARNTSIPNNAKITPKLRNLIFFKLASFALMAVDRILFDCIIRGFR